MSTTFTPELRSTKWVDLGSHFNFGLWPGIAGQVYLHFCPALEPRSTFPVDLGSHSDSDAWSASSRWVDLGSQLGAISQPVPQSACVSLVPDFTPQSGGHRSPLLQWFGSHTPMPPLDLPWLWGAYKRNYCNLSVISYICVSVNYWNLIGEIAKGVGKGQKWVTNIFVLQHWIYFSYTLHVLLSPN